MHVSHIINHIIAHVVKLKTMFCIMSHQMVDTLHLVLTTQHKNIYP